MFSKLGDMSPFLGMHAKLPRAPDIEGRIVAPFGKSGKLRLQLSKEAPPTLVGTPVLVEFRRFIAGSTVQVSQS